jgi:hypothetical protein
MYIVCPIYTTGSILYVMHICRRREEICSHLKNKKTTIKQEEMYYFSKRKRAVLLILPQNVLI